MKSFVVLTAAVLAVLLGPQQGASAAATAAPAAAQQGAAPSPESASFESVVTDWVRDIEFGFKNASLKHGRSGSGFFRDLVELKGAYEPRVAIQLGEATFDGYREDLERLYLELQSMAIFKEEGWRETGTAFTKTLPDGREHVVNLYGGYADEHGLNQYACLEIYGEVEDPQGFGVTLDDVPPRPGEVVSLMWRFDSEEGRAAFKALLDSSHNDFEGQLEYGPDGTVAVKESVLNPASPLGFMEVKEYAERIDVFIDPAPLGDDTSQHLFRIRYEFGYDELFADEDWEGIGDAGRMGKGAWRHVMMRREFRPGTNHTYWVLSSIKKAYRELHARNQLVASDLHPRVSEALGCVSGDCDDGFGELRYMDPKAYGTVFSYRGRFKNGRFSGPGAVSKYATTEALIEFGAPRQGEALTPEFIGFFVDGEPRTVNRPLPWVDEMGLCKELNRPVDCEHWRWALDRFSPSSDAFSVAVFATQAKDDEGPRPGFLQHQSFEGGRTVVIDRPFTVDFGTPAKGTCRGGSGALDLPGIGRLDGTFDSDGKALDHAYLTLLSGEVYDVRITDGIPMDFMRVAVPEGLSWKRQARSGAWIMLRKNTCLEGDTRSDSYVRSVVLTADGQPKESPGYLTRIPGEGAATSTETFTLYYHTGVERMKEKRRGEVDYVRTERDGDYFDVNWNEQLLDRETTFAGSLDDELRLNGEYGYQLYGRSKVAYFRDDIRYRTAEMTEPVLSVDELRIEEEQRRHEEVRRAGYEEVQRIVAAKRAAELARQRAAEQSRVHRPKGPFFGLQSPSQIREMNAIFARPSAGGESSKSRVRCTHCAGFGHVTRDEWRRVRRVEETTLFFTSYYVNEKVSVMVTCPSCYGTGDR